MNNSRRLAFAGTILCCSGAIAQPSIVIADDAIAVAGKPLSLSLKRLLADESPELVEALVARRAQAPDENPCGQIQAPGSSTFALINKVLTACTAAGLTSIGLREKAAQPIAAVSTLASSTGVSVVLRMTTTELGLSVGGSVKGPFAIGMLLKEVQALRARMPDQLAITVVAEDAVPLTSLLEVLDACARAGLSQVTLKANSPPEPALEAAVELLVQGTLDKEAIRKVVLSNQAQVRACYEKALAGFPKLDGKVTLKFSIAANGTVSSVVAESTSNTELSGCISDRLKSWVFSKPKGGGAVVVTYPFTFKLK